MIEMVNAATSSRCSLPALATPNLLIYSRRMARGVVYLLNFPDGRQTTLNRVGAGQAVEGTEIAPGWVINRIQLETGGSYTYDGFPISFEAWVEPKPPLDPVRR